MTPTNSFFLLQESQSEEAFQTLCMTVSAQPQETNELQQSQLNVNCNANLAVFTDANDNVTCFTNPGCSVHLAYGSIKLCNRSYQGCCKVTVLHRARYGQGQSHIYRQRGRPKDLKGA